MPKIVVQETCVSMYPFEEFYIKSYEFMMCKLQICKWPLIFKRMIPKI